MKRLLRIFLRGIQAVVPLAGTWIETSGVVGVPPDRWSFPLRERGLKQLLFDVIEGHIVVVPLAGTWIETMKSRTIQGIHLSRSPCGNVD